MAAAKKPASEEAQPLPGDESLGVVATELPPPAPPPVATPAKAKRYRVWAHGSLSVSGQLFKAGEEAELSDEDAASAGDAVEPI